MVFDWGIIQTSELHKGRGKIYHSAYAPSIATGIEPSQRNHRFAPEPSQYISEYNLLPDTTP